MRHISIFDRQRFSTTLATGVIKTNTTSPAGGLGLTHERPSYRPIGKHLSPRSVSVWRLVDSSGLLSLTSRPTLYTHWSLMGYGALLHWVVTSGRSWLVRRALCNWTVTRKASMLWVPRGIILKRELVILLTSKTIVALVIPELGLVLEDILITPIRVETQHLSPQIMATETSKLWDIFWCSKLF